VIEWFLKEEPKFGYDLGQGLEVARAVSDGECFPVRQRACVLNESFAQPDNLLRKSRAAATEGRA